MNIEAQQKPPSTVSQKEKEEEEEEEEDEEEAQRTPATEPPKETEAGLLTAGGDAPREAAHLKTGRVSRVSRFKGVSWHRRVLKWVAQARVQGKTVQVSSPESSFEKKKSPPSPPPLPPPPPLSAAAAAQHPIILTQLRVIRLDASSPKRKQRTSMMRSQNLLGGH